LALEKKKSHESTFKPPASHPSWSRNAKEDPGKLDLIGVGLGVTWLRTLEPYEQKCYRSSGGHAWHVHVFIPCGTEKLVRREYICILWATGQFVKPDRDDDLFLGSCEIKVELPHGAIPPPSKNSTTAFKRWEWGSIQRYDSDKWDAAMRLQHTMQFALPEFVLFESLFG
jgi:hypothetical protein